MPRHLDLAGQYKKRLDRLRSCCRRVDQLQKTGTLNIGDSDLLYESTFLNAIGLFEGVLEALLFEFVCGKASRKRGHYSLLKTRTHSDYRTILLKGRRYIDLLPYSELIDTVKMYLNDGKPFTEVEDDDRQILAQATLIRNAIAHRSTFALAKFRKDIRGVGSLPSNRQFPGPLLRKTYRAFPMSSGTSSTSIHLRRSSFSLHGTGSSIRYARRYAHIFSLLLTPHYSSKGRHQCNFAKRNHWARSGQAASAFRAQ